MEMRIEEGLQLLMGPAQFQMNQNHKKNPEGYITFNTRTSYNISNTDSGSILVANSGNNSVVKTLTYSMV